MDKRLKALERFRKDKGLKHADIAKLLGANSLQSYNNWRYRDSLPKEYYDVADKILGGTVNPELDLKIIERVSALSDGDKELALLYLEALLKGRK